MLDYVGAGITEPRLTGPMADISMIEDKQGVWYAVTRQVRCDILEGTQLWTFPQYLAMIDRAWTEVIQDCGSQNLR